MAVELVSIQGLWPLFSRLPWVAALLARWYFTASRLAGLVYVDLYPRHESAQLDLGQIATFRLHLQVMNLSPFDLQLDQANFHLQCGSARLETIIVKKERIPAGASKSLYLSGPISDSQATHIAKHHKQNETSLEGNIEFSCLVRSFAREINRLSGVQSVVINASHRQTDA